MINECLTKIVLNIDLSEDEAHNCMMEMINGEAGDIKIAAFLTALRAKGESIEEITGFVKAMRSVSIRNIARTKQSSG